jgi:hypothetical protein
MEEVACHVGCKVRTRAFNVEMHNPDVGQLRCARYERVKQDRWRGGRRVHIHLLA